MLHPRRVFVSVPADEWLTRQQRALTRALIKKIQERNLTPELFFAGFARGLAAGKPWTERHFDGVIRRCVGAVIIGFPRHIVKMKDAHHHFASEYSHYEGAVATTHELPLLLLRHAGIRPRGIFHGGKHIVVEIPHDANHKTWFSNGDFSAQFERWDTEIRERRDVFLGYCGKANAIAGAVKRHLKRLGVTVLDWQSDFPPGGTILEAIQKAAAKCTAGIFLFTNDDRLSDSKINQMAPRDNVVFEAGYFCHAKGKERVLIIAEQGSKMPADLGGNIYASLPRRSRRKQVRVNIDDIKDTLHRFVAEQM